MPAYLKRSIEDMQRHVEQLCRRHDINYWNSKRRTYSLQEVREIFAPPIRSAVSYGVVLHEIGHILGRHQQSRRTLTRETWAWNWARSNALIWTPAMERCAGDALAWYAPRAAKIDRRRFRWSPKPAPPLRSRCRP
jgi:hypothetical protein